MEIFQFPLLGSNGVTTANLHLYTVFQFPLLGSDAAVNVASVRRKPYLSIPFVGFETYMPKVAGVKRITFNSLCWVLIELARRSLIRRIDFQFPLLGSSFNGGINPIYVQYFQFPLLGSEGKVLTLEEMNAILSIPFVGFTILVKGCCKAKY